MTVLRRRIGARVSAGLKLVAIPLLAVAVLHIDTAAQEVPDFSGKWTSQGGGGRRGGGGPGAQAAGSGWGSEFTIVQRAEVLTIERHFFTSGDLQPPLIFQYATDGSETRNTVLMGRGFQEQRSTASWQGESLVITTLHEAPNPSSGGTGTVTYSLSFQLQSRLNAPRSLVIETTRSGIMGGITSTSRTVYSKG
jgi:hypothetical protein